MIDRDDIGAWVRLLETPGIGRETARRLLAAFGSPQELFATSVAARREVVGAELAAVLTTASEAIDAQVARTLAWLEEDAAETRAIVTLGDSRYPPLLLHTADPPLLLYAQGRCEMLLGDALAVVGSRNPTPQGRENARAFSAHLSDAGLAIVSGLALGIDGAAHAGGLEGRSSTIAVVGTGADSLSQI